MENAVVARRRSGLAKGLFAVSLVAVGAAALSPDWAAALKAQGYYGSVDLGVTLTPSQTPRAGETVDFLVTVRNGGPDAANRVRTIAGAQNLHVLETNGCAADPLGYPQCALPSPLAAGASGDYLLRMKVPTLARGNMVLSVSATSDDDEIAPGDEVALFKAPIDAVTDLGVTVHCDRQAFADPTSRVICDFDVRNTGLASALRPTLSFIINYPGSAYWSCAAPRPSQCPTGTLLTSQYDFQPISIEPGEALRVRGEFVQPPAPAEVVGVNVSLWANETDAYMPNNFVGTWIAVSLFSDDFEPTSPSPNP